MMKYFLCTKSRGSEVGVSNAREDYDSYVKSQIMENGMILETRYGLRRLLHCDHAVTARPLNVIERLIMQQILPFYANTHSQSGMCAMRTDRLREEARAIVRQYFECSSNDRVIFNSYNSVDMMKRMIQMVIAVYDPSETTVLTTRAYKTCEVAEWEKRGVVVQDIEMDEYGEAVIDSLTNLLEANEGRTIICSLMAINVLSGCIVDVGAVTALVHKYRGVAIWDYSGAMTHVDIKMRPSGNVISASPDALLIPSHKILGGVSTPGIIIAKAKLFDYSEPIEPGGGTVAAVTRKLVRYADDVERREEGGTPNIIGSIKIALVLRLISSAQDLNVKDTQIRKAFEDILNDAQLPIFMLSAPNSDCVPIFTFVIYHKKSRKLLHHTHVLELLHELFGIRGSALSVDPSIYLNKLQEILEMTFCPVDAKEINFIQISFHSFYDSTLVEKVSSAVRFIALNGWKFYLRKDATKQKMNCILRIIAMYKLEKDKIDMLKIANKELGKIMRSFKRRTHRVSFDEPSESDCCFMSPEEAVQQVLSEWKPDQISESSESSD